MKLQLAILASIILMALLIPRDASADGVISTPSLYIFIQEQCPEDVHFCTTVKFRVVNKKDCSSSEPVGWADIRYCSDKESPPTPCRHDGYSMNYRSLTYRMSLSYPSWDVWAYDKTGKTVLNEKGEDGIPKKDDKCLAQIK